MDQSLDTIASMRFQESSAYVKADWMPMIPLHLQSAAIVDMDCRTKMCAWFVQVVDFCKFRRETVEIALSYLDRFLLSPQGADARVDRSLYQLASMTALYTAVKIHEAEAMDPNLVSKLSRGAYAPYEIEEMERILLTGLQWRVNPPTTMSFVRELMNLIPQEAMDLETRNALLDVTKFQIELTVGRVELFLAPASLVALAALQNSLSSLPIDDQLSDYISYVFSNALQWNSSDAAVMSVQDVMFEAVTQSSNDPAILRPCERNHLTNKGECRSPPDQSPRSISAI
ncbi:hypothetical protein FisN_17Hh109 [Fistulifera solaris]|jgi:hypothetical protein|uniref:Cyclin-like domain-containing protein n=1 Tax=Fistulifera solaris TaxID=1519565 RepID=A0A1Z5JGR0_FISSO|nr:hypothetical protein FisN_17Hh109 [Fistulifera solaris]|eukprot:GAX13179.1 hypothetical protein FisN_17Hh109 [Fistulifera solaris]